MADPAKFQDYKEKILKAINEKTTKGLIVPGDPEGFILIDGFLNIPLQQEIGGNLIVGGPSLPTVAIVGKSTGMVHSFAVKILVPEIPI